MHSIRAGITGRVGMLAALALLVAAVAVVPMFSRPAYAAGLNLNGVVTYSQFIIPGAPTTKLDVKLADTDQPLPGEPKLAICAEFAPNVWKCTVDPASQFNRIDIWADDAGSPGFPLVAVDFTCQSPAVTVQGEYKGPGDVGQYWSADFPSGCKNGVDVLLMPIVGPGIISEAFVTNTVGIPITVADDIDALFPKAGELLLGKTELVKYDNNDAPCGLIRGPDQFCVIQRAKVGQKKQHPIGTQVKLATQLTSKVEAKAAHTTLNTTVTNTQTMPFQITVASDSNFGPSGFLSITHSDITMSITGAARGSTEYFQYNNAGAGCPAPAANKLCLTERALQPNLKVYSHPAHDTVGILPIHSYVDKHFQIDVKSNAGFFPAGNLEVYEVDGSNQIVGAELMGHNNAATLQVPEILGECNNATDDDGDGKVNDGCPKVGVAETGTQCDDAVDAGEWASPETGPDGKVNDGCPVAGPVQKTVAATEFHTTGRGALTDTFKPTAISQHDVGSIVTGPDTYLLCRSLQVQPLPVTLNQTPGPNSVGVYPVCYTSSQPNDPTKPPAGRVVGQQLIALNGLLGVPFLSTGPLNPLIYPKLAEVDPNGTTDGRLILSTPCVTEYGPGSNLQVTVDLTNLDKLYGTTDYGTIKVVTDTIPSTPGHTDCDDPAGTADISNDAYIYPGDTDPSDDDTDGDGCKDNKELGRTINRGGLRDPWNKWDYFNPSKDRLNRVDDILLIVGHYGLNSGGVGYDTQYDRGGILGPYTHNLDQPNGQIRVADIIAVVGQYGHDC